MLVKHFEFYYSMQEGCADSREGAAHLEYQFV